MLEILRQRDELMCCGCNACALICPSKCIQMELDEEGFSYPILKGDCISCGLCDKVCPILNSNIQNDYDSETYVGWTNDSKSRLNSSSGGIFSVIALEVLNHGGVVFGAYLDYDQVYHIGIDSKNDIMKIQGSKYVQSEIGDVFSIIKEKLRKGMLVYFVGTPCQVHGLNLFLKKKYENLLTSDLVCHGVPSSKLFKAFLNDLEVKYGGKVDSFNFRDKSKFGWSKTYSWIIKSDNDKKNKRYLLPSSLTSYGYGYDFDLTFRRVCYNCPFAKEQRCADITLADCWGINKIKPDIPYRKGISLVIVNSLKGDEFLNRLRSHCRLECIDKKLISCYNSSLFSPAKLSIKRDLFYKEFVNNSYKYVADKYLTPYLRILLVLKYALLYLKRLLIVK
ncbi:Coenzyme F420 hydrogenase/dehydrogenase, beta subunit C-terminal domain [Bacteroides fragilis]|jgi:putative F420H2-dehydrogenase|nr:Coenzyme F420 hydrogenase/dehydrogenase, beta subunit C-terminal domain [Bacteroides fragilis]